jgi:hypothetical protein
MMPNLLKKIKTTNKILGNDGLCRVSVCKRHIQNPVYTLNKYSKQMNFRQISGGKLKY